MARDTTVRYEALLIAVREAIEALDESGKFDRKMGMEARAILLNALEEIGEPVREDPWAV